jgi:hypothetical protein
MGNQGGVFNLNYFFQLGGVSALLKIDSTTNSQLLFTALLTYGHTALLFKTK